MISNENSDRAVKPYECPYELESVVYDEVSVLGEGVVEIKGTESDKKERMGEGESEEDEGLPGGSLRVSLVG